jgi:hypothetical protein
VPPKYLVGSTPRPTDLKVAWKKEKVYATLEGKIKAVVEFLRELEAEPERVRSLTW